jgi:outer membrane lipoprotein SlyB
MEMKATRGALATALLIVSGCAQAGSIGDILGGVLGGGQQPVGGTETGAVVAEVRAVDARNQVIEIRTEDGQNVDIRYDQNTRVVYRQQEYQVTALEPGDVVRMNVQRSGNEYYTQDIEVQQSVQERQGETGAFDPDALYQFSGTVEQVDQTRGLFTLRSRNGDVVTVAMPYNATSSARDRFQRLRRGNSVAIEGRFIGEERIELTRFL